MSPTRSHRIMTPAVILRTMEGYGVHKIQIYVASVKILRSLPYRVTLVLLKPRKILLSGQSATPQTRPSVIPIYPVLLRHLVARITKQNTQNTRMTGNWLVLLSPPAATMCLTIKSRSLTFSKISAVRSQELKIWTTRLSRLLTLSLMVLETWSLSRSPKYWAVCS